MSEVSLFIEDTAIKVMVTRGRRVEKWASLPLEPGLVSDGLILDESQVAGKLRGLFKQQKIGAKKVTAGLSGLNSIYRLISLPELPAAILPEAVNQEAARIVPAPLEQFYLSYQTIPAPPGETGVFLAAFPQNTADALFKTLSKAGIKASTMDLAPLALCRTVDAPEAIIIDARSAGLDIAILVDRVPQVIRSFSLPGEAESLAERMQTITEELERTIAFYNSGHQDKPLPPATPIFVSGDLAEAPESWMLLAGSKDTSVSELPSPMQAPEDFDASQFMINIGLSLKNLPPEKEGSFSLVNFNALPESEKPRGISLARIFTPVGIVIGIGLVFWLWLQVQDIRTENEALRSQVNVNQSLIPQQREEIAALNEDVAAIEPQIAPLEAKAGIFTSTAANLDANRSQINRDLSGIVGLMPDDVDLTGINHSGPRVIVTGTAPEEDDIFQYARNLRSSGRYSGVIVSSIIADYKEVLEDEEIEQIMVYDFTFLIITTAAE
ncbi:MAG: pilus assembly protein PilM [Dehalococcoidales bacterium]|nr:pilus assembly protein PilM [Dehalococcoidales bacterium]